MKKSLFTKSLKQSILAVPAAALMLGAAHGGTTVGVNFQSWYYDSGTTPQTIGYGQGYQTTGFPVTAKAFGVAAANWINTEPLPDGTPTVGYSFSVGAATVTLNAVNFWESDIGNLVNPADEWTNTGPYEVSTSSVLPGNDEVTWSFEDNTGWTNSFSGMSAAFPDGYAIGLISPNAVGQGTAKCSTSSLVFFTDNATFTNWLQFNTIYTAGNSNYNAPVGLLGTTLTNDSITFGSVGRSVSSSTCCSLAGFILTDQPVITLDPANTTANQGSTLTLTATVIGLGPLSYQWQHAGTNFPGATTVPFSKTATPADAGSWVLVATNQYGKATSDAATVTINQIPLIVTDLVTATNTVYAGTPVSLSVVAGGANPLSYQWYKNGAAISGATNSSLILSNNSAGLSGYNVIVSNQYSPPLAGSSTNYLNVVAAPDKYTSVVAADGPSSFWPLNETTGTTAYDYAGAGHNGAISNNMTLGGAGPESPAFPGFSVATKAYQFDGSSSFVDCGTAASLNGPTDFTVEAWVNTASTANQIIAQQRDVAGFTGEYAFSINSGGTLSFYIYNNGYQGPISTLSSIADGAWHHVVAVRSGVNLYIYVDGAQAASGSGSSAPSLSSSLRTYIGADERNVADYFSGSMADVAIYSYALSTGQIIKHYVTASGAPFVVTLKPGGMIEDSKPVGTPHPGQGHNVGWTNSVTDTASPPVTRTGVGVFADTSNSQIATAADPDFNSSTGTIMFWLMANAPITGPGSEGAMIFDRRTTNGAVVVLNDGGGIEVQCAGAGYGTGANNFTAGYVPDGNWHHVAVTYDQSATGSIEIFVDGVSVGSQVNSTNWTWPATQEFEIGKSHDTYWQLLTANLDDFRIYSRILTAAEIGSVVSSDSLVDASALKVRYNFDTAAGVGESVSWSFGTLYTSPTLGPAAVWTPLSGVVSPYAFMPSGTSLFFRAQY